jgi:hypothetical protein
MPVETLLSSDTLLSEQLRIYSDFEPTINGNLSSECQENEEICLEGPYDRLLGDTEHNWCRAVSVGTGITVLGFLFRSPLNLPDLQTAIDVVQVSALSLVILFKMCIRKHLCLGPIFVIFLCYLCACIATE